MKAIKSFDYYLDGNKKTTISEGDEVPEIAIAYAIKHGFCEKAKSAPANKAKKAPQNKAK